MKILSIANEKANNINFFLDLITRCRRLRDLDIEGRLQAMEKDSNRDVRDRTNSALDQLREVLADEL